MCTKILKKESSSRALAFVLLMFMMPLGFIGNTHSCRAMQHDQAESRPLLGHANISINGNARDVEQGRGDLTSVIVQFADLPPKISVDAKLLEELDSSAAVEAMKMVKVGLRFADAVDAEATNIIEEIYRAAQLELLCNNKADLGEILITRARKGADEVQSFFVANRDRNRVLIETIRSYEIYAEKLRKIIEERKNFLVEQEKLLKKNEKKLEKYKSAKRTRTVLAICLPVAVVVTGLGTWALTMYLGGNWNR